MYIVSNTNKNTNIYKVKTLNKIKKKNELWLDIKNDLNDLIYFRYFIFQ